MKLMSTQKTLYARTLGKLKYRVKILTQFPFLRSPNPFYSLLVTGNTFQADKKIRIIRKERKMASTSSFFFKKKNKENVNVNVK
jgi:hypothetical protein